VDDGVAAVDRTVHGGTIGGVAHNHVARPHAERLEHPVDPLGSPSQQPNLVPVAQERCRGV
jgi:hypothetical protein